MQLGDITENSQLECNGKPLLIKRYISNGASANVFAGEYDNQTVAVKAIRSGATSGYRTEFEREAKTMQAMWNLWDKRYPMHPQVVPCYKGGDPTGELPFIVEEFIDGLNITQAIRELPGGVFSEQQALQVAAQIGRMLVILHEDLNTCYGDIKFNNFIIVGDPAQPIPQIKVIDWNVLSSYKPENVARELLYISTYLMFMLTNISVEVNEEQNSAGINLDTSESLKKLTYGSEQFLRTALHSDPTARFQTAQDWLTGIEQLIEYWDMDKDLLVKTVSEAISSMGLKKDYEVIHTAQKMITVAIAKGAEAAEDLVTKLNKLLGIETLVGQIIHQLESNNADMAARIYRTVMNQTPYNTDEQVVVWGCAAVAVETIPNYSFNTLQRAVEERLACHWSTAKNSFQMAGNMQRSQGLNDLANEAYVHELILNAENQEIEYRKDSLHQAASLYDNLIEPLKKLVRTKYDPQQKAMEAQVRYEQFQLALRLCAQAAHEPNVETALGMWEKALSATPSANSKILTPLQNQVIAYLDGGQYEEAERLAGLPHKLGQHNPWCGLSVKAARGLHNLQVSFVRVGAKPQILQEIIQYEERSKLVPEKERNELFLAQGFQALVENVFDSALAVHLFTIAEPLRQMALRIPLRNSSVLDRKYIGEWQKFCKNLFKQVEDRLNKQSLNDDDFDFIDQMLNGLTEKDLGLQSADFSALMNRISNKRLIYNNQKEKLAEEQKRKKARADDLIATMQQAKGNYEKLEQAAIISPVEAAPVLRPELTRQLFSFVAALLAWKKLNLDMQDSAELESWANQKMKEVDLVTFETLVKAKYPDAKKALLDGLDAALHEGREQDVSNFLSGVDDGAYAEARKKEKDIQDFLSWGRSLRDGNDDPTPWLAKAIAPVYWQRGACAYFGKKVDSLLADFQLQNLAKLAQARMIARRLSRSELAVPQPAGSWKAVVEAAQALDHHKSTRKTPAVTTGKSGQPAKSAPTADPTQMANPQADDQALKDELINRIDNLSDFDAISTQSVKPLTVEKASGGRGWKAFAIGSGVLALGLAVVLGLAFAGIFSLGPKMAQTPSPVVSAQNVSPVPGQTAAGGEVTATSGAALPAGPTSTYTPTPKATDTPIPTPTSIYALAAYGGVAPLPNGITGPMYLIDDARASFAGKDWKVLPGFGINGSMHVIDSISNTEDDQVEWKLDQPLSTDGLYEIFILDPAQNSGTNDPISYQIYSEDVSGKNTVEPLLGSRSIRLLFNKSDAQKADLWRSIGIFDLRSGQLISISLIVPKNTLKGYDMVGADAVLIASLPAYDPQIGPAKDLDQKGRRAQFVTDDSQASFTPGLDQGWEEASSITDQGMANVWGGKYHQINVTKDIGEVSVEWAFTHPLPAGEYSLQVFIPAEMAVGADFKISLDGKEIDTTTLKTVTLTKDAGAQGSHFPPEPWKIVVPDGSQGMLVIKMTAAKDAEGVFACDAVVLSIGKK